MSNMDSNIQETISDSFVNELGTKIKKIVLVNPPMLIEQVYGDFAEWGGASPPTGLCYIAAFLRERGYDVIIIDAEALRLSRELAVQAIVEAQPDLVGFSCKTLWVISAHNIAKDLKGSDPKVIIVAGGHHVTALPKQSLDEFSGFDVIVMGEGELTLIDLIEAINKSKELSSVNGIAYRARGEVVINPRREEFVDINHLPKPAFDLLPRLTVHYHPNLVNIKKLPAFPLITSRGCPFHCAFCDRSVFGNVTRIPPAEYTFSIILDLYHQHGIRNILFDDDNILIDRVKFDKLLKLIKESGMKLSFTCQARVNSINEGMLKTLKDSGCWQLMFGIESGNQQILDKMQKGTSLEQISNAIRLTKKAGIKTFGMFIIGFPGETLETLKETEQFIKNLQLDDMACFLFTPLPGSVIFHDIHSYGEYQQNWEKGNSLENVLFVPKGLTIEILKKYVDRYNSACYLNLRQILSIPKRFTSMAHFKATLKSIPKVMIPNKKGG